MDETQQQPYLDPRQAMNAVFNTPMYAHSGSILVMTNPENELYRLELHLRGQDIDQEGRLIQKGSPLMNDKGINSIMGQVKSMVSQLGIMGDIEPKEMMKVHIELYGDSLRHDLMMNYVYYNIADPAGRSKITAMCYETAFLSWSRARKASDKRFWKGSQQELITRVEGQNKGSGLFRNLFGWGKS